MSSYAHHIASKNKNFATQNNIVYRVYIQFKYGIYIADSILRKITIYESENTQRKNIEWVMNNREALNSKDSKGNLSICDVKNMS